MTKKVTGVYTLIIGLNQSRTIVIGRRGGISFDAGCYAYVGSALKGLEARIARHLRRDKLLHWHSDYFLRHARVEEVLWGITDKNEECAIAGHLIRRLLPIPGFGCSDCPCASHLFYSRERSYLRKAAEECFTLRDFPFSSGRTAGKKKPWEMEFS